MADDRAGTGAEHRTRDLIAGHRCAADPQGCQANQAANQRPVPGFV